MTTHNIRWTLHMHHLGGNSQCACTVYRPESEAIPDTIQPQAGCYLQC